MRWQQHGGLLCCPAMLACRRGCFAGVGVSHVILGPALFPLRHYAAQCAAQSAPYDADVVPCGAPHSLKSPAHNSQSTRPSPQRCRLLCPRGGGFRGSQLSC